MTTAAVFSPVITPGDPRKNVVPVLAAMKEAGAWGASLLLLPALCLTGCSCGDLFRSRLLRTDAELALGELVRASKDFPGLTAAVGLPLEQGGRLYSCAAVLREGRLLGVCPVAGDSRWFSNDQPRNAEIAPADLPAVPFSRGFTFAVGEVSVAFEDGAAVHLILSDEPADADSTARLSTLLEGLSAGGSTVLCACPGTGESTTDFVYTGFAGASSNGAPAEFGEGEMILAALKPMAPAEEPEEKPAAETAEAAPTACAAEPRNPFFPGDEADTACRCDRVFDLQVRALVARMQRTGSQKLVLGISGGLDSALAMLVSAEALRRLGLPAANLVALTMPCFGTTRRTRSNAELISEALGADFRTVDITAAVEQHFKDIGHDMSVHNSAFENAQARQRTYVLMDLANDVGGLVVGTGDMSELALGWCTYNGDHMSMYAVNAGVPKTAVRLITARRAELFATVGGNPALAAVLRDILDTPITPELLPNATGETPQLTEDLVGPYELHDFFLHRFLTRGPLPKQLLAEAQALFAPDYAPETVEKWLKVFLKRFFSQQFKRSCMPDGPMVMGVSLSPREGFRMPSDISSAPWLRNLE